MILQIQSLPIIRGIKITEYLRCPYYRCCFDPWYVSSAPGWDLCTTLIRDVVSNIQSTSASGLWWLKMLPAFRVHFINDHIYLESLCLSFFMEHWRFFCILIMIFLAGRSRWPNDGWSYALTQIRFPFDCALVLFDRQHDLFRKLICKQIAPFRILPPT